VGSQFLTLPVGITPQMIASDPDFAEFDGKMFWVQLDDAQNPIIPQPVIPSMDRKGYTIGYDMNIKA
jgi:hypothetical protein